MMHVLSILVENKPGVLSRISGLISRRGFNIESLSVGPTEDPNLSRITTILECDDVTSDQAIAIETGIGIVPRRVFNNRVTITGGQIVKELITMQYHSEFGAIGLCNQPGCRVGGDCSSGHAQQSHGE